MQPPLLVLFYRFRTAINVLGDSIGAGIVNHLSQSELAMMEETMGRKIDENVKLPQKQIRPGEKTELQRMSLIFQLVHFGPEVAIALQPCSLEGFGNYNFLYLRPTT